MSFAMAIAHVPRHAVAPGIADIRIHSPAVRGHADSGPRVAQQLRLRARGDAWPAGVARRAPGDLTRLPQAVIGYYLPNLARV